MAKKSPKLALVDYKMIWKLIKTFPRPEKHKKSKKSLTKSAHWELRYAKNQFSSIKRNNCPAGDFKSSGARCVLKIGQIQLQIRDQHILNY